MSFVNTVETVGDAALSDSIIDRSITELNDNISTSIGQYAFRDCKALAQVSFPGVTSTATAAFWECTALAKAEFSACVAFGNNTFYGCSALTALILRCADQVCTLTGNLSGTPIASGTGYIYVPAALVDTYKAASGWSTYAAQIRAIEDYAHVIDPYTWSAVARNISDGTYATVYKIGDLVPLDLGTEGVVNMQIAAFDADELADGSGYAPISWVSKELLKTSKRMNPAASGNSTDGYVEGTGSIGGWPKCEMRTYLNDTIKPLIPSDVLAMIKPVTKYSLINNTAGSKENNIATTDDVWIPSYRELGLSTNHETSGPLYTTLFGSNAARIKYKVGSSSASNWWLRSALSGGPYHFHRVDTNGGGSFDNASNTKGVVFGFCT